MPDHIPTAENLLLSIKKNGVTDMVYILILISQLE